MLLQFHHATALIPNTSGCFQKSNLFSADEDLLPWRIFKAMCFLRQFQEGRKRGREGGGKEREEES